MKKFFDSLLVSVLLVALISVTAWADDCYNILVDITPRELNAVTDSEAADYVCVDVDVVPTTGSDAGEQRYLDVTHPVDATPVPTAKPGDGVHIYYNNIADYNKPSVSAAYSNPDSGESPSPIPISGQTGVDDESRNFFYFTMPKGNVKVNVYYEAPTKAPASTPGNILPPSPAYNSNEEEAPQEPQSASAVPTEAPMSVLPANTVTFGSGSALASTGAAYNRLNNLTKNNAEKFSATVLNLEAKDLSNQNGLAAYYAAIEGKEADILATYGVYASKDLSAEDNGKLTSLTWKNITAEKLDKNTRIKAVCYNLIDGTYTIEGEIDEFGNVTLKNFIIRPAQTNITVFICK